MTRRTRARCEYLPQRIARTLGETIEHSYGEREGAFLRALLLGDKKYLDEEDASNLSEVGLSHVMAVSGLHCCFSGVADRRAHGRQAAKTPLRRDDPAHFSLCVCHGPDAEHSARVHHDLDGHDRAASGARQRPADVHLVRAAAHSAQKSVCHREHQLAAFVFRGVGHYLADAEAHRRLPTGNTSLLRAAMLSFSTTLGAMVFSTPLAVLLFRHAFRRVAFEQPACACGS